MSAFATVTQKSFNGNFTVKIHFPIIFADADIGSLKSLHTLFDKYLDHMLVKIEQKAYGPNHKNFELFDKNG